MADCISNAFKRGALEHVVNSGPKIALYTNKAALNESTARYTPDNEVRGDGYQSGGMRLEGCVVVESDGGFSLVAHSPLWQNATITASAALIYLSEDSGRAVRVIDFGRVVSSTNDAFRVKFPAAADGGLIGL